MAAPVERSDTSAPVGSAKRKDQTAEAVRRYTTDNQSIRAIAQATGMSYGKVHALLTESGTRLRIHGSVTRSPAPATGTEPP